MSAYRADVIVPTWNGRRFLEEVLPSVAAQEGGPYRLAVADNGSNDGTEEWARGRFPDALVVQMGENAGFARAVNACIRKTDSPYVVVLNNDARPAPGWLKALCDRADADPNIGSVGSKSILWDLPEIIDSAGDQCAPFCVGLNRGKGERDAGQYDRAEEVFSACGVAALYRRAALDRVGLFEEDFFAYYEDLDLGFRLRLAGWSNWYEPAAAVHHKASGTTEGRVKLGRERVYVNLTGVLVKNMPAGILVKNLPAIALTHGAILASCLWAGWRGSAKMPAPPMWRLLLRMLKKRGAVQRGRTISNAELQARFTPLSAVAFLRGKMAKASRGGLGKETGSGIAGK